MAQRTKRQPPNIIQVINNRQLFGSLPKLSNLSTWTSWLVWLKAVFGLPMDQHDLAIFQRYTGRSTPPSQQPSEIYTIVGRRGGKSFMSALVAVFVACFGSFKQYLTAGERAVVLILARDKEQSRIVFNYVAGILRDIAPLYQLIVSEHADEIELENGVVIMVKTSDFRAVRGLTIALCITDELAFWDSQGVSPDREVLTALPDREVLTALRPAMATIPGSKLLVISTPYARSGVLYEAHKDYYGVDNDSVFVWKADTRSMNPTVAESLIQREMERDPDAARAEWLAGFRDDLEAAFGLEALEACVITGREELPPSSAIAYRAFVDPSGGRHDAFTLAVAHKEGKNVVLDLVRAWHPPFDPSIVVAEASETAKRYGVLFVSGDNYGGEWPVEAFRGRGIRYERAVKTKSELYLNCIPVVNSSTVELLDNRPLLEQFRRLERRRGRTGKDTIDHPPRLFDDMANSVAGVIYLVINEPGGAGGFNPARHVLHELITPILHEPIYVGQVLSPHPATVLAQTMNGHVSVLAAFATEHGGLGRHLEGVRAWIARNAPWALSDHRLLVGAYEANHHEEQYELVELVEQGLGGIWDLGPAWGTCREAMFRIIHKATPFSFEPSLRISANVELLPEALSRSFDGEEKTVLGAVLRAFGLVAARVDPSQTLEPEPIRVDYKFDVFKDW